MKVKLRLLFSLVLILSGINLAQIKTITNADFEKYKQRREKAEAEYRAKHKELGLPSPKELEARNAEDQRRLSVLSARLRTEQRQQQDYWRTQAAYLRSQIFDINSQIDYLNKLIATLPVGNTVFYTTDQLNGAVFPTYSFGNCYGRGYWERQETTTVNPANNVQTAINAAAANPNPYYGTPLYQAGIKAVIGPPLPRRRYCRHYCYGGYYYQPHYGNSQRDELVLRLQRLIEVRAGLLARWRILAEDARRAGVRLDPF